ncbi:pimeloyl-ACP methyl ester carboxylesterase [Mesorhizobium sp. J18]|uniref:alpha/beta fold hydrolase n=1 Tax=Mesorhizobium sp. J18 TaxID=935263 RepID=UPI00119A6508|nr:alpha/beta hydrolase [Mesorhizobium sp. J18]TWG91392.1 pimeloyl-ACP methyl ester carboxylesterase [Mesorhizobium sp. J18]
MTTPRSAYIAAAGFEIHVTEWGDPKNPALVMWHGLARTGRDFDEAASALSDTYFVICPDTLGRGLSSWASDPEADYSYQAFGDTALAVFDHYGIDKMRWVGTSMGGLIGVTLAADRLKGRMTHLVINDIGPEIPAEGSGRIASYVGNPPVYDTVSELEAWLRRNYAPFGKNSDEFWRRMADTSYRRTDEGRITVHYDPRIVTQLTYHKADLDVWDAYDAVEARTLLLRGEDSDVLPVNVAKEMTRRGPRPRLEIMHDCGHAPTLTTWHEIALLREFLAG